MSITRYSFVFVLAVLAAMLPEFAAAAGSLGLDETIGKALCEVANAVTGKAGRGIATIAVVLLGIGAFFGKVSWSLALLIAVGIAVVFGASTIVGIVSASSQSC